MDEGFLVLQGMSYIDRHDVRGVQHLELLAKQVVEGFIIGLHKSPFHGFSVEFAEHRIYNPGESTKNIDWKVYARTDKLFTKRYEEETNMRCQIVIDVSSSMYFPEMNVGDTDQVNKLGFSALAGASLMNMLNRQRDAYGLSLFADTIIEHTPARSSTQHYKLLLSYLERLLQTPEEGRKTSTAQALHEIADRIHRRSLVVIFSDLFDTATPQSLLDALQHLKYNKHEVILFHVTEADKELEFMYDDKPYLFKDLESGEELRVIPGEIREKYLAHVQERKKEIELGCLQYNIDFVEADISQGYYPILERLLLKRKKMNI